jgi:2,3-bisphosphoglycerate-independent phosphoglycerate mutase
MARNIQNAVASIEESYANNVTDEFIHPYVMTDADKPLATIEDDDVVIFFNFRTDRGREGQKSFSTRLSHEQTCTN